MVSESGLRMPLRLERNLTTAAATGPGDVVEAYGVGSSLNLHRQGAFRSSRPAWHQAPGLLRNSDSRNRFRTRQAGFGTFAVLDTFDQRIVQARDFLLHINA